MMIEQFHDENMRRLYEHYLFELPKSVQMNTFLLLSRNGVMTEQQTIDFGENFFAVMTTLTFRYLLTGELTEERKEALAKCLEIENREFGIFLYNASAVNGYCLCFGTSGSERVQGKSRESRPRTCRSYRIEEVRDMSFFQSNSTGETMLFISA